MKSIRTYLRLRREEDLKEVTRLLELLGLPPQTEFHTKGGSGAGYKLPEGQIEFFAPAEGSKWVGPPGDADILVQVGNSDAIFQTAKTKGFKVAYDSVDPDLLKLIADRPPPGIPRKVIETLPSRPRTFMIEAGGLQVAIVQADAEQQPSRDVRLDASHKKFAITVSRFNSFITERLLDGALQGLRQMGAGKNAVAVVRVPGAFEIPSAARTLAETKKYDAIICLGCLLRGDTAHYDVIVNEVTRGIGQSAQETGIPHAFGVLTCDTLEQAIDRAGLKMGNKGFEAALAAVEMANLKAGVGRRASGVRKAGVRHRTSGVSKTAVRHRTSGVGKSKKQKRTASSKSRKS
jgi:6,7-dimethyl-8-ribityllumazine synthase